MRCGISLLHRAGCWSPSRLVGFDLLFEQIVGRSPADIDAVARRNGTLLSAR
jgi:hypothetical protein